MSFPFVRCAVISVMISVICFWGLAIVESQSVWAQGSLADYQRSESFRERTAGKVSRDRVMLRWLPDGHRAWYRVGLGENRREFVLVDALAKSRTPVFDHAAVAEKLSAEFNREVQADRLPIEELAFGEGFVELEAEGRWFRWASASAEWSAIEKPTGEQGAEPPARGDRRRRGERMGQAPRGPSGRSPDEQWEVFEREGNLWLREVATGNEQAWTADATEEENYDGQVFWSPDSTHAVARKVRRVTERQIPLVESSPADQLQPKLHMLNYAKPGDEIEKPRLALLHVAEAQSMLVDNALFAEPWSIQSIRWDEDSSRFLFEYNQRGHQVLRIVAVDAATGTASALFEEVSPTFIDYAHKHFLRFLDATHELVWMSERDGWNHLYLVDLVSGEVKNQITQGEWVVQRVVSLDVEKRQILFEASGIVPGQDPYYLHLARINFDGSGLTLLTHGNGTHETTFSPDRRFVVDRWSRVDQPVVTELRDAATGELLVEMERADWSALQETGWQVPEPFVAKGRDGVTDIYGVVYRPSNFDPSKKWPVIETIYAGPQGAFVPKSFAPTHYGQELTELGFVVVQIDGMGTNWRSKAFHDVAAKNLADSGFPDRILWLQSLQEKYPYIDLERVGIYGGSAGGQSALRALLGHGDFYDVAVADCGCHDNRIDKIWWNELWMGWPIESHYEEQSNITQAHRLQGKLMLIVGEMDRNVDPASTLKVVDALIKADKDFDLLFVPGGGHGIGESAYGQRRRRDFFVRHLLGVEPRWE